MIRAVPDNNVWLGAIISPGGAHHLLLRAEAGQFRSVTSNPILHELMDVLALISRATMISLTSGGSA